jgi:hypothetical protein
MRARSDLATEVPPTLAKIRVTKDQSSRSPGVEGETASSWSGVTVSRPPVGGTPPTMAPPPYFHYEELRRWTEALHHAAEETMARSKALVEESRRLRRARTQAAPDAPVDASVPAAPPCLVDDGLDPLTRLATARPDGGPAPPGEPTSLGEMRDTRRTAHSSVARSYFHSAGRLVWSDFGLYQRRARPMTHQQSGAQPQGSPPGSWSRFSGFRVRRDRRRPCVPRGAVQVTTRSS